MYEGKLRSDDHYQHEGEFQDEQSQREDTQQNEMDQSKIMEAPVEKGMINPVAGSKPEKVNSAILMMMSLSEDRLSDNSAIYQACLDRKKEVRGWEEKRSGFLQEHNKVVEVILKSLEKRVKVSSESMNFLVRFFKERLEQEVTYSKSFTQKVPQLAQCWKDLSLKTEQGGVEWYPALSQALRETDSGIISTGKSVATLVMFLEKHILKDLLLNENDGFEKALKLHRQSILDQMSLVEKSAAYTKKKNEGYVALYTAMLGGVPGMTPAKLKKQRQDLLSMEVKFRQAAFEEISQQKTLGQLVLTFWEEARKAECTRLETIQKVFDLYMTKHQETYGVLPAMQATLNLFKQIDVVKESGDNFSISSVIRESEMEMVKKTIGIGSSSQLAWTDVQRYVSNFNFKDISISKHPLVQKKMRIMRDVGSITKSFKECWMVATVDDMLLFYDEIDDKSAQDPKLKRKASLINEGGKKVNNTPKKKFLLDFIQIKPRDDPVHVDIIETTQGLIFESTEKQLIKFIRNDDFEEFKVFMERYKNEKKLDSNPQSA